MPEFIKSVPRWSALFLLILLLLLSLSCSSEDGGTGDILRPYDISFYSDGSDSINVDMTGGETYIATLSVRIEANGINDLFAVFFPISFDDTILEYAGFSSQGGVLGESGIDANYMVDHANQDPSTPILIVGVSREGHDTQGIPAAIGTIITLNFNILARGNGRFDFIDTGPWDIGAFNSEDADPGPDFEPTLIFGPEGFSGGLVLID